MSQFPHGGPKPSSHLDATSDGAGIEPRPRRPVLKRLAGIPTPLVFGVSIVVALVLLWYQGALRDVVLAVADADLGLLALAAPIYVASLWLLCYRWHVLVRMAQGRSDLPRAAEAFLTSVVINYAAPIGLAVPSRAALTKRALGLDARATGTIALWEIGVDVLVLGFGTVLWFGLAEGSLSEVRAELADSATLYAVAGIAIVVLGLGAALWFMRTAAKRQRIMSSLGRIIMAPKERPAEALLALAVTTFYWVVQGLVLGMLVRALGVTPSFEFILGLTSLPILVGMLSPIPGGAVVREALMYLVARLADQPGDEVVAAALIYRFALFAAIPILYLGTRWVIARRRSASEPERVLDPDNSKSPSRI